MESRSGTSVGPLRDLGQAHAELLADRDQFAARHRDAVEAQLDSAVERRIERDRGAGLERGQLGHGHLRAAEERLELDRHRFDQLAAERRGCRGGRGLVEDEGFFTRFGHSNYPIRAWVILSATRPSPSVTVQVPRGAGVPPTASGSGASSMRSRTSTSPSLRPESSATVIAERPSKAVSSTGSDASAWPGLPGGAGADGGGSLDLTSATNSAGDNPSVSTGLRDGPAISSRWTVASRCASAALQPFSGRPSRAAARRLRSSRHSLPTVSSS